MGGVHHYSPSSGGGGGGNGSLTQGALQNTSFSASAGTMYPVDVDDGGSGINTNIIVTFPGSPTAGDEIGIMVSRQNVTDTGSSPFSLAPFYCVEPATNTVIEGASYTAVASTGGANRSLWLDGDTAIYRYFDSTIGWVPISSFVTGHLSSVYMSGDITTNVAGVEKDLDFDTALFERSGLLVAASGKVIIKRAGQYRINVGARPRTSSSTAYQVGFGTVSATSKIKIRGIDPSSSRNLPTRASFFQDLSNNDSVFGIFQADGANKGATGGIENATMTIEEILE